MVSGDLDEILRASFPGAVSSALRGDVAPMLRLKRHAVISEGGGSPREFSSGLYAATTCEEIPFPWPRFSDPASRFGPIHDAVGADPGGGALPIRRRHRRGQRLPAHVPPLARGVARARRGAAGRVAARRAGADAVGPDGPAHPQRDRPQRRRRLAARPGPDDPEHRPLGADGRLQRLLDRAPRVASCAARAVPARCRGGLQLFYALPPAPLALSGAAGRPGRARARAGGRSTRCS